MNRFIVVPIRVADDVALARHAVQAAHSERSAILLLDLSGTDKALPGLPAIVAEFVATARGNGQQLHVLATPEQLAGLDPATAPPAHDGLQACLVEHSAPSDGRIELRLTLPARADYLPCLRGFLGAAVRERHGEEDAFQVELLVDELCLNAVENSPSDHSAFELTFRCEGDELEMEVINPFDDSINPERIMRRRLRSFDDSGDYMGERGRGLFLVARLADSLRIRSLDGGRIRVSVTRRLGLGRR